MRNNEYFSVQGNIHEMGNIYPISDGLPAGYKESGTRSFRKFEFGKHPNFLPDRDGIPIKDNVKITDYLPTLVPNPLMGLLVGNKVAEVVQALCPVENAYFPASVKHQGIIHPYVWIHYCFDAKKLIDWSSSEFHFTTVGGSWIEDLRIDSLEHFENIMAMKGRQKMLKATCIKIDDYVLELPHLFSLGIGGRGVVASETLLSLLGEIKSTGFLFQPADWLK